MKPSRYFLFAGLCLVILSITGLPAFAQKPFTIEQILSYPFSYELASAKKADRIAWFEFEQGRRNVFTAAAPDFKPVRLTDFMEDDGIDLTNLEISDDGAVIVFVRGHDPNRQGWVANPSQLPDGGEQAIWAVRPAEAKPFRLAAGSRPALSPDGQWVMWIKDGQVYGIPVPQAGLSRSESEEEDLKPLFRTWGANNSACWSPDGRKIAFVSDRQDHSFIGVYDLAGRKITYLAPSVDRDSSPTWSGDGKRIAFIRRPGSAFAQIIAQAQQAQGTPRQSPIRDGLPQQQQQAQTGRGIAWGGDNLVFLVERKNWRHYYSVPTAGGVDFAPVELTPGDGEAEYIGFSADGKTLYFTSNAGDIDHRDLWKSPTAGGGPVRLTKGDGIETEAAPLASGRSVAVFYSDAKRPRCVALVPAAGGEAKIINPRLPADFPLDAQVVPQSVNLKAADGLEFHNQLFVPKGVKSGERRPAILFTHGGPGRQMLLGYHYMFFYHMAYAMNQYFANRGYVVISVNYRSGIGYGRDFRMAPNRGAQGSSEYQDVYAAAKYLQSRPDVDPNRIGLYGLSYGGLLTAMGLSRNSDIFKAGVDIAGVHLWGNSLDTNGTAFKASSVATIDQWKSPVLLVQGDDDRNVAFSQTTGLVQLLRARNIPHELIVFPDEVHDFLVFKKWVLTFTAADDFFNRFLRK
ncbi:MAG: prolyl oligopeptidase family serine peptidase [Candidatus Aminicenantes bacterium]|nr:prolyl oligopeptidase family serine peptidase [Candidatus Aminicenantes bacterium]